MLLYTIKVFLSASVIVAVTEIAKRSSFWGGILASVPLVSVLSFIWLYIETQEIDEIIGLSWSIFWLVLPSLTFFVTLPILLKRNMAFPAALCLSLVVLTVAYVITANVLKRFGVIL